MKTNSTLFIGFASLVFISAAAADYIFTSSLISFLIWTACSAALSGIFLLAYLVNGQRAWTWLFTSCIFAALSEILFVLKMDFINDSWAVIFGAAGLIIPAVVGYLNQPRRAALPPAMQRM